MPAEAPAALTDAPAETAAPSLTDSTAPSPTELSATAVAPTPTGTPADGPARAPRRRVEVLDGVRLLAALFVVLFHFTAADRGTWQRPTRLIFGPLFQVSSYGFLGVELFFMISGFVICMSGWGRTIGQFAVSRIVRLYPAYWFAIVLTTLVLIADPAMSRRLPWTALLANIPMTESWARVPAVDPSYWTLGVELTFYLLFAVTLSAWGLTYRRTVGFCVGWLAVSMLTLLGRSDTFFVIVQPTYAPYFVAGVVLYLMYRFGATRVLWLVLGCAYGSAMYRLVDRIRGAHRPGWHLHYWVGAGIVTTYFVVLTMIALGRLTAIRGRWLTVAGTMTYPLYLLHQQLGETVIRQLHTRVPALALVAAVIAALLGLAWLTHRYVERPVAARLKAFLTGPLHLG